MRPDVAKKYLKLAIYQARLFSSDPSTKVGALILAPGSLEIISSGHNELPTGLDDTRSERRERPLKYLYVEHAERSAIYSASRRGISIAGAVMVVSHFPCADCARGIIGAGLRSLVSVQPDLSCERWGTLAAVALEMFEEAGVALQLFPDSPDPSDLE